MKIVPIDRLSKSAVHHRLKQSLDFRIHCLGSILYRLLDPNGDPCQYVSDSLKYLENTMNLMLT
jgi:hypothetical protein